MIWLLEYDHHHLRKPEKMIDLSDLGELFDGVGLLTVADLSANA